MKLRGNMSYRKFREAMLKCGQVFIADLLYEEEATGSLVDENDILSVPSLKLSLTPEEIKQLVLTLDAR
ncbi:trichohyalin isoform X3, partial [Biomphalaria glabrata]